MEHRFGAAPASTLGIEEELLFVDAETFEVRPGFSRVVGEGRRAASSRSCSRASSSWRRRCCRTRRRALRAPARAGGDRGRAAGRTGPVYAAGSHPLASATSRRSSRVQRYERMAKSVGAGIWRQLVCGLHVHVSIVVDRAARVRGSRPLAAGRCSRFRRTRPSSSARTPGCARRGQRRCSPCRPAGRRRSSRLGRVEAATGGDSMRRHWDAWPRPEYGTLEVRVMDMQTDVRRTAGFAAIVQALVLARCLAVSPGCTTGSCTRAAARRRRRARRTPPRSRRWPSSSSRPGRRVRDLARLVLEGRPEAERQLELGIAAVPRDVAARTLG